ncbi:MAG: D-alanine--D-alanine ligase family protein [Lachnospiraceae bacterium]
MKTIAVIFGGQSSEHEVSCMSAANVIDYIDKTKYELLLIGITKMGQWLKVDNVAAIRSGEWSQSKESVWLLPDAQKKSAVIERVDGSLVSCSVDVIFPVLHGLKGEDGTIQGLFEMSGIPYVGCGVLASAVSMDKFYTKIIVDTLGIRQAQWVGVKRIDLRDMEAVIARVEAKLVYPVFVKPSCAGSSKGVSKAHNREELEAALIEANRHDDKILVEETIVGREIECAVFSSGEDVKASGVGEILAAESAAFYDFDAKYFNQESKTDVQPVLPEGIEEEIRQDAMAIFRAVGGYGLSRVDFFLDAHGVVFNEINTLPGFTAISMYPMLWEHKGMDKKELIEALIQSAYSRRS